MIQNCRIPNPDMDEWHLSYSFYNKDEIYFLNMTLNMRDLRGEQLLESNIIASIKYEANAP